MDLITRWVQSSFGIEAVVQSKLFSTFALFVLLLLGRYTIIRLVTRRTDNPDTIYSWRKTVEYIALVVGVFGLARIWISGSGDFLTYLGLLSAGLAIALQDPITNFIGWAFIIWRHPFSVGDRIEINGIAGDVIDIRYFQFSLLEIRNWVDADQSTGRMLHVPNKMVFTHPLANFTEEFEYIWNELPVLVTFESDWQLAKQILERIAKEQTDVFQGKMREQLRDAARRYPIRFTNLSAAVYTSVEDSGIMLTVRHLCAPRSRRATVQKIWEQILIAFAEHDTIDFAYPTQRVQVDSAERTIQP